MRVTTVTPIQDLLHRIRWDPAFGSGRFEVAYLDRVAGALERVPVDALRFDADAPFGFEAVGRDGEAHFVPYHRVREVCRDGVPIWQRPARERR
jgi:uncharacterized protein (UPF0248 family)